jgi:hypothetical protein
MTLPATFNEALEVQALAFARAWITQNSGPLGIFHPDAEIVYGKQMMKRAAQYHPFFADDIVYFAEKGSEQADLALRELIAEYTDRREPLTAVLAAYNIRLLNPSMRKKPGQKKAGHFVRDIGIVLMVKELTREFHLSPNVKTLSGNRIDGAPGRPTACSIAAAALTEAGIGVAMGFKNVERVWHRYLPIVSGHFPAGYVGLFDQAY